jgi:hypothetical protein
MPTYLVRHSFPAGALPPTFYLIRVCATPATITEISVFGCKHAKRKWEKGHINDKR